MTDSHNSQELFPTSADHEHDPLNIDVERVGETNVESGEIPLNQTECAATAISIGNGVVETRRAFLKEAA